MFIVSYCSRISTHVGHYNRVTYSLYILNEIDHCNQSTKYSFASVKLFVCTIMETNIILGNTPSKCHLVRPAPTVSDVYLRRVCGTLDTCAIH